MDTQPVETPAVATTASSARVASNLAIPIAILIGFAMIAAAIFFSGGITGKAPTTGNEAPAELATKSIRPVDESDHILGNPNAPIVFVEYSDFDCPFCKKYHEETIKPIMEEYGSTGKVALVFRQFPLQQLHPNAPKIAEATECVAELGGNDAFWKFVDLIFGEREINAQTDMTKLTTYATTVGVDSTAFTTCLDESRYATDVNADLADGANAGVTGTPNTFVLVGNQQGSINGAQPYEVVKQLIENILSQMESSS